MPTSAHFGQGTEKEWCWKEADVNTKSKRAGHVVLRSFSEVDILSKLVLAREGETTTEYTWGAHQPNGSGAADSGALLLYSTRPRPVTSKNVEGVEADLKQYEYLYQRNLALLEKVISFSYNWCL